MYYTLFSKSSSFVLFLLLLMYSKGPSVTSNISCPHIGIYKSSNNYHSSIPISRCSTGPWTLSIGCDKRHSNELTLSSSCPHDLVSKVQVITSLKGICLASWRTDHRFQRTIVLYENTKAFCLVNKN